MLKLIFKQGAPAFVFFTGIFAAIVDQNIWAGVASLMALMVGIQHLIIAHDEKKLNEISKLTSEAQDLMKTIRSDLS